MTTTAASTESAIAAGGAAGGATGTGAQAAAGLDQAEVERFAGKVAADQATSAAAALAWVGDRLGPWAALAAIGPAGADGAVPRTAPPPALDPVTADVLGLLGVSGGRPGALVGVWAHPDDETYLSGGLMAAAAAAGARVVCVTATAGELGGDPSGSPAALARQRRAELAAAMDTLGVGEHVLLGCPDGGCAELDPSGPVARIAQVIRAVQPAAVVTFGPDGYTGHPDHRAVSRWATAAFRQAAPPGARLLYAVTTAERHAAEADVDEALGVYVDRSVPDVPPIVRPEALALRLRLSGSRLDRKVAALRAHYSQTAGVLALLGEDRFAAWVAAEEFVEWPGIPSSRAETAGAADQRGR